MATLSGWPVLYGTLVIQRRISIARPPSPPTVSSDVLVLNSRSTMPDTSAIGSKVLYLDLRLSLPITSPGGLDWTFAGLREIIPLDEEKEGAAQYRWGHAIDSHGSGEPPDEGTMVRERDKDGEEIEVETGLGLNPETGEIGPYEEVWKEESVTPGTPFAFVMSNADPDQSTRFMAVLGPHAIGLWKRDNKDALATTLREEAPLVHAVRLWSGNGNGQALPESYMTIFSTGYQTLDDQLAGLVNELTSRGKERRDLWKRGASIVLGDSRGGEPLRWTVWDAGYVHE